MSNFSPKLEEATDEQLMYMVNELDFRVVPLASDELTRRTLRKLQKAIEISNRHSVELEIANYRLQMIMVILTAIGTLVVAFPVLKILFQWLSSLGANISLVRINLFSAVISAVIAFLTIWKFKSMSDKKIEVWIKKNKNLIKEFLP